MPSERDLYPEVVRTFRHWPGAYIRKHSDITHALRALHNVQMEGSKSGHPDYTVLLPPYGFFVEVKAAGVSLPLDCFSSQQREWLDTFGLSSWVWLFLGDDRPTAKTGRPRRAYLLHWSAWLMVEHTLGEAGLSSLPYQPHQHIHRLAGLDAATLLAPWALVWAGNSRWHIPVEHTLWRLLVSEPKALDEYRLRI